MKKQIVTNTYWFKKYLIFRKCILLITLVAIVLTIKPELVSIEVNKFIQGISISLLLTFLIFDFLQCPSIFELSKIDKKLVLGFYLPDTRYFVNFNRKKIKYFEIDEGDKIIFIHKSYLLPLLNRATIKILKENGSIIQFKPIDFSWANKTEIKKIIQAKEDHNHSITA